MDLQDGNIGSTMAPIMFQSPAALTKALDAYCGENNLSRSAVIRIAIADKIGYTLTPERRKPRGSKYANEAERKAEIARKAKEKRDEVKRVMDMIRNARKLSDMEAMAESIGVKLEEV